MDASKVLRCRDGKKLDMQYYVDMRQCQGKYSVLIKEAQVVAVVDLEILKGIFRFTCISEKKS